LGAGQRNISVALVVATASFDAAAAIARLLVASAVGSIVLMMIGGLATEFPTTANAARDQVLGSEAFRGVDRICRSWRPAWTL
jgi:hypothetical protein